ncbi:MAG: hypothetical protein EBZ49_05145 [Proteobacteria bacterium]|nr:hypothetical protein [Pseudomonadota bacterium]
MSSLASLDQIQKLAGVAIFSSGPHKEKFDLNSTKSFGQYNKEFVNWIWNQVVPVLVDPSIRAATQERFNAYLKTPLLKLHAALLFSVTGGPSLKNLAEAYQKQLSSPQGVESAFNLLYPMIANYPNPLRVTPESVGFWVRRTMDGTAETLMHSLMTVLNAYAPEDLKKLDATIKNSRSSK